MNPTRALQGLALLPRPCSRRLGAATVSFGLFWPSRLSWRRLRVIGRDVRRTAKTA